MIPISTRETIRFARNLFFSARVFPYGMFLITLFPFSAVLIKHDYVDSLWSLLRILPFVLAMAAGFTYNTVCDAKTDPKDKNPISRGELLEGTAKKAVIVYSVAAVVLVEVIYQSWIVLGLFLVYQMLWLAYSGLGIRFKESIFATVVASFVLWTGPPMILLSAFEYYTDTLVLLLSGLFAVYVGHEIKHTVIEHDMDQQFGLKTFAVILGKKRSTMIEYATLLFGYVLILVSLSYSEEANDEYTIVFFSALFAFSLATTVLYGHRIGYGPRKDSIFVTLPYTSTKIFIIAFGLIVLNFSALLIFFVVWLFLLRRYP
ncbi:MAG: UbiA prenyltransferase family protein [Thermoplasmata archaeon]|nr:UbiA prenyltransferase family protein [Thermoplasmata archaeon]